MATRWWTAALILGLVAAAPAGCRQDRAEIDFEQLALANGHGVHLFGPTALPMGEEDLGYFAYVMPSEPPLLMFDRESTYVRTRIWDIEDNRRPGRSYQRRRTFVEHVRASYR